MLMEPIDAHVETLRACESEDAVDDVVLRSWPDRVSLSESGPHREVVDVFERFERWAERRGVSVRPPFEVRTVTSQVTDESKEVLVTPLICVAVYEDERLAGVFPHSEGEDTYTVNDAIAKLRTGELPVPMGATPAPERPDADACPDCGGQLIDGQGVFACTDCEWIGSVTGGGRFVPIERELSVSTPERSPARAGPR